MPDASPVPAGFTEQFADANGARLRYVIGGEGRPVVLLGFVRLDGVAGQIGDRPEPLPMFLELGAIPEVK